MEKESKTARRTGDGWRPESECRLLRNTQESLSRELTLPEEEVGVGGHSLQKKQVQRVLSILFLYIAHFATVQGWLSKAAQQGASMFLPWSMFGSEPMSSATVYTAYWRWTTDRALLHLASTEETDKPAAWPILGLATRVLTWAPTVWAIAPHPNSRPEFFIPRTSRRKERPDFKMSTSFSFIYPHPIKQEQVQISELIFKKSQQRNKECKPDEEIENAHEDFHL